MYPYRKYLGKCCLYEYLDPLGNMRLLRDELHGVFGWSNGSLRPEASARCHFRLQGMPQGPKSHTNMRILHSGPKAHLKGDIRNHGFKDPCVYLIVWAPMPAHALGSIPSALGSCLPYRAVPPKAKLAFCSRPLRIQVPMF